jgi:YHS domain-containing protein
LENKKDKEKKMKSFSKVMFVLVIIGFVLSLNSTLAAQEEKTECTDKVFKCAGCSTPIAKDAAKFKVEYKGKTYYFASEKCQAEFQKDPEKFAKCCEQKTMYVCPVSECKYKSDKPGKCPHCDKELTKMEHACCLHKAEHEHGCKKHQEKKEAKECPYHKKEEK